MAKTLVLTVIGQDRIGIVDHVTNKILKSNSNIGNSRMAHLGGEFAMMVEISIPDEKLDDLKRDIDDLQGEGFIVNLVDTGQADQSKYIGWVPYQINISGADHEGVVHDISHFFSEHQINIENMETSIVSAPMSGTPLFSIKATVMVPPNLTIQNFTEGLEKVADHLNMEAEISPYRG